MKISNRLVELARRINLGVQGVNPFHMGYDFSDRFSDIFGNNYINTGNIENYFTESCSVGPNNKFLLNLFTQSLKPAHDLMNKFKKN